jgi:hypothetical protein
MVSKLDMASVEALEVLQRLRNQNILTLGEYECRRRDLVKTLGHPTAAGPTVDSKSAPAASGQRWTSPIFSTGDKDEPPTPRVLALH